MDKKVIALIDKDKILQGLCKQIRERDSFTDKKVEQTIQQMRKMKEKAEEANLEIWKQIEERLKACGDLPEEYKGGTDGDGIAFNLKENIIYIGKSPENHHPFGGFMIQLQKDDS